MSIMAGPTNVEIITYCYGLYESINCRLHLLT
jgi:hypothetical protein